MRLNRLLDVVGIALLEFIGFEGLVRQAAGLGAIFDAAGLRQDGQFIHIALEVCEWGASGLEIKRRALFAQGLGLYVSALGAARGRNRQSQRGGSRQGEKPARRRREA
jgi:hypothetical protein